MAKIYNYYFIGKQKNLVGSIEKQTPKLLNFSTVESGDKDEMSFHHHSYLEIFYFFTGEGIFEVNNTKIKIKAHDFLAIDGSVSHLQYSTSSTPSLTYYCLSIDNINLPTYNPNSLSKNGYLFHRFESEQNPIYTLMDCFLQELQQKQIGYLSKVNSLTNQLYIDLIRLFSIKKQPFTPTPKQSKINHLMEQIKLYIEDHYQMDLSLEILANHFFVSKSYLLHQFKKYFDISPIQYLIAVRIENAKLLLLQTDLSIVEIANKVGFNNPAYFTETFTKSIGITPTLYKKLMRNS